MRLDKVKLKEEEDKKKEGVKNLPRNRSEEDSLKPVKDLLAGKLDKPEVIQKASILINNKKEIKDAVSKNPDLTTSQKKQAVKYLNNDKEILKHTEDAMEGKAPSSLSNSFKQALTFFAPQLIGGIIGGALEGDAGAYAGMKQAGEMRDAFIDYTQEERKLESGETAKPKAFQQARDASFRLDDGTIVPLMMDPNSGEALHPVTQEPLSRDQYKNIVSSEDRRLNQFQHKVIDDSQFSGKQQEVQSGFDSSRAAMVAIDSLFDVRDKNTGVITGRYNDLAAMAGAENDKYVRLRTEAGAAIASFLKTTSGATVSEQERQFLRQIIPTTMDNPSEFQSKLEQFKEIVIRQQRKELMSIMQTQPLKRAVAAEKLRILNAEENGFGAKDSENKVGPSKQAGSAYERIHQMDAEKRKRYEEYKRKKRGL